MWVRAKILLRSSAACSKLRAFASSFICLRNPLSISPFLPSKNNLILLITLPYSCLLIAPEHTPGHRPIWALKHGLLLLGKHLSLYGKILRIIFSPSLSSKPCGNGPNLDCSSPNLEDSPPSSSLPLITSTRGKSSFVI